MAAKKVDFSEILIRQETISADQLAEAKRIAKTSGKKVSDQLVVLGYATSDEVMRAIAKEHGLEFVDLNEVVIPPSVVELVPESVARENAILPMAEDDGALKVIVSDPLDLDTFEKLRFILNRKVEIALAPRENILESINRHYGQMEDQSADSMLQEFTDTAIDFTETEQESEGSDEIIDETSAPIVRLVQLMISEAVNMRASDIHVEPFEDRVRIRYRIDGVLVERDSPPRRLLGALLSRIKILANMDIAERRRPQDGRIKVTVGEKQLDLRVSILPTNHGQSAVMRLLDKDSIKVGVRQLGLSENDFRTVQKPDPPPQRDHPRDWAHRLGKDHHAVRRAERAEPAGPQDHYRRGSGGVLPAGSEPGRGEAPHRAGFRQNHPGHAAAGTQRDSGRRNA